MKRILTATRLRQAERTPKGLLDLSGQECLDIRIGPKSIDRTLRIMDALIKAIERQGGQVQVKQRGATHAIGMKAVINEEPVTFYLEEAMGWFDHTPTREELAQKKRSTWFYIPTHEERPNGHLALIIDEYLWDSRYRKRWADGARQTVEGSLNSFLMGLARIAVPLQARRLEAEERERRYKAELARLVEVERRKQEEANRRARLEGELTGWAKSQQIREYVAAVRTVHPDGVLPDSELGRWLIWAEKYADSIDPLIQLAKA